MAASTSGTNLKTFYILNRNGGVLTKYTEKPHVVKNPNRCKYDFVAIQDEYEIDYIATSHETALQALSQLQDGEQLNIFHESHTISGHTKVLSEKEFQDGPFYFTHIHKCKKNNAIAFMHEINMPASLIFNNIESKFGRFIYYLDRAAKTPLLGVIPAVIMSAVGVIHTVTSLAISILFSVPAIFSKNARIITSRSFRHAYCYGPGVIIDGIGRIFYSTIFCWFNMNKNK